MTKSRKKSENMLKDAVLEQKSVNTTNKEKEEKI